MPGTAQAVETHWCITPSVRAVAKNDPANAGNPADAGAESAVLSESGGVVQTLTTGGACDFWYFYDANGNVGQLLRYDAAGGTVNLAAAYEYDPYGNTLAARDVDGSGIATANKYRFSTKRLVDYITPGQGGAVGTTGLYYYGYRFYSPGLGRWISRDPIEEKGGQNLHGFCSNGPTLYVDARGNVLFIIDKGKQPPQPTDVPREVYGGMVTLDFLKESVRLEPCDCSDAVKIEYLGLEMQVTMWYTSETTKQHELFHVEIYGWLHDDFDSWLSSCSGRCMSKQKAECVLGLAPLVKNLLLRTAQVRHDEFDCAEYGETTVNGARICQSLEAGRWLRDYAAMEYNQEFNKCGRIP